MVDMVVVAGSTFLRVSMADEYRVHKYRVHRLKRKLSNLFLIEKSDAIRFGHVNDQERSTIQSLLSEK